jgi:hypothetical protein
MTTINEEEKVREWSERYYLLGFYVYSKDPKRLGPVRDDTPDPTPVEKQVVGHMNGEYGRINKSLVNRVLQICNENGEFTYEGEKFRIESVKYEAPNNSMISRPRSIECISYSKYIEWGKPKTLVKRMIEKIEPVFESDKNQ